MLGVFFKHRVGRFYDEREEKNTDEHVRNVAHEIEMVVRFGELSGRGHKRRDLERRVDADRADHDHSKNDEREDDEKNSVIDAFGFQRGHLKIEAYGRGERTDEGLQDQYREHEEYGTEIQSPERRRDAL